MVEMELPQQKVLVALKGGKEEEEERGAGVGRVGWRQPFTEL